MLFTRFTYHIVLYSRDNVSISSESDSVKNHVCNHFPVFSGTIKPKFVFRQPPSLPTTFSQV